MDNKILEIEKIKLDDTINKVFDAKNFLEERLNTLGKENLDKLKDLRENPETSGLDFFLFLEQLHQQNLTFNVKDKYTRLEELKFLEKEPYFARIDLKNNSVDELSKIYIGKFGYTEEIPVITDWRAKIASVYYRYRYPQKNVKYQTPEGEKVRDLELKRTFEIEDGQLIKYYNNDIQLDESEIISEKIEKRTGGVLEDIVETIQESQLDIIESDPRKICIVQGCVGSGKSTVAIHKLSHIFFNHPDIIKPERSILIAKNQILVSYLSTLFPKLGIFDINYKTLRELIVNIVFREKINLKLNLDENQDASHFNLYEIEKLNDQIRTVSKKYQAKLDKLFNHEDYESFGGFKFAQEMSPIENLTELVKELEEELGRQKEAYNENPKSIKAIFYKDNMRALRKIIKEVKKMRLDIKNKEFVKISKDVGILKNEKLGYFETLVYLVLYLELVGLEKFKKYEYCVIDEGQDFSLLEYLLIQKLVLKGRFCILGDLNQGYRKEGINSWEEISKVVSEANKAKTFTLETNYRSTKPIIDYARKILEPYTQEYLPNSINRVGKSPNVESFDSSNGMIDKLSFELNQDFTTLNKSIGLICYDQNLTKRIDELLKSKKLKDRTYIRLKKNINIEYSNNGVYLMDFEDCKGLEFSKVYVLGLNPEVISEINEAKKAFIAVSRAMNELNVYYINKDYENLLEQS